MTLCNRTLKFMMPLIYTKNYYPTERCITASKYFGSALPNLRYVVQTIKENGECSGRTKQEKISTGLLPTEHIAWRFKILRNLPSINDTVQLMKIRKGKKGENHEGQGKHTKDTMATCTYNKILQKK